MDAQLATSPVVRRPCPLCGGSNETTPRGPYSRGPWAVKACGRCGFVHIDTAPDYAALAEVLAWERTAEVEAERRRSSRPLQQSLSRRTRWRLALLPRRRLPDLLRRYAHAGNVVDLGCGDGGALDRLDDAFVPHGIEISRELAARADERFCARGGRAVNAPALEGLHRFPDGFFSAATLRSYLEHELRPREVLTELRRTLAADGVVVVKVPNYGSLNRRVMGTRWCGFRHPDHLNYFTPASLRAMAQACGFAVQQPPLWRLPTGDNMWALLRVPAGAGRPSG